MIRDEHQLTVTLDRIAWMQKQIAQLRRTEQNAVNYHAAAAGFLREIDRMQIDVRDFLSRHPSEVVAAA